VHRHARLLLLLLAATTCGAAPPARATARAATPATPPSIPRGPSQPADTGVIAGTVTLTTRVRGARLPAAVYSSRSVPRHDPPRVSALRNVVVYLKGAPQSGPLPILSSEMKQENETFIPHILPITLGSTVEFSNDDPFFHNVFSLSRAATFDLGRYPRGQARSETFEKPGLVKVYCRIHSQMSATIVVMDHPYFAVPADDGAFALKNVPPGTYTLVGWHERVGERSIDVRVEPGEVTEVAMTLPVEDER
jgi:plastocyanin